MLSKGIVALCIVYIVVFRPMLKSMEEFIWPSTFFIDGVEHAVIADTTLNGPVKSFVLDGFWCNKSYTFMYNSRIAVSSNNGLLSVDKVSFDASFREVIKYTSADVVGVIGLMRPAKSKTHPEPYRYGLAQV